MMPVKGLYEGNLFLPVPTSQYKPPISTPAEPSLDYPSLATAKDGPILQLPKE